MKAFALTASFIFCLITAASAQERTWVRIEPAQAGMFVHIAELGGVAPNVGERSAPPINRNSAYIQVGLDRFRYDNSGHTAFVFREFYDGGALTWSRTDIAKLLDTFNEFKGKNIALGSDLETYSRGGYGGELATFTYTCLSG